MKNLIEYIQEKLVINKNYKNDAYELVNRLINKYTDINDYKHCDNVRGKGVIFNDIEVTLNDNGISNSFADNDKKKCMDYAQNMLDFGDVYRWVFGTLYDNRASACIIKMFDELQKSNVEFDEIFFDMDKGYSIECYETDKYMILVGGTEKYSYLYISIKN